MIKIFKNAKQKLPKTKAAIWFSKICENRVRYFGWPQMTIWRLRIALWIPKATNTHSQYVILIAFALQQRLHEHNSVLSHTYIACLVVFYIGCPTRYRIRNFFNNFTTGWRTAAPCRKN
jgi:hypothetical protein